MNEGRPLRVLLASSEVVGWRRRMLVSVKSTPSRFRTSQGRIDQVEKLLSPITSSIPALPSVPLRLDLACPGSTPKARSAF